MAGLDPLEPERRLQGPRKLIAYEHDVRRASVHPEAPPDSHAVRERALQPASPEGIAIPIEFLAPDEARKRRAASERLLPSAFIGMMFLETHITAGDDELARRIRGILMDEGIVYEEPVDRADPWSPGR